MKQKILLIFLQLTCLIAYPQLTKLYISPKTAQGGKQSLFIDSLRFCPLKMPKAVSTKIENSSIYTTPKYFLVIEYNEQRLLIFSRQGQLLKQISYKSLGGFPKYDKGKQQLSFFMPNKAFSLTEKDIIQIRADFFNKKNKKYFKKYIIDLTDSTFALKKSTPTPIDILEAYNYKDDMYFTQQIHVNKLYKDTLDYEVKLYQNDRFLKGFFPYHKQNETRYLYARGSTTQTFESGKPDTFFITRPYVDTIYTLANNSISPVYKIVLPMENSLPATFFEKPFKNMTERENFERNNGWLFSQVYRVLELDQTIFLMIGFFNNYGQYVYNKKTNATHDLNKIKPDSASYNMPSLLGNFNFDEKGRFYTLLSTDELIKMYALKDKSAPFPKELEACFIDPKNPTPVIVSYSIKAN